MAAVVALAIPAYTFAHHSFAMFDPQRQVTLHGVVKEFRWSNPHVFIQLLATGDAGRSEEEWSIEMSSPEHLVRAGWKPGTLKPGDKVTLIVHPLRDGSRGAQYVSGIGSDGEPIGSPPAKQVAASGGATK